MDLPKKEKEILRFWKDNNIFQKTLEKTKGKPRFVFYEGPPFANGKPGIHHLLARSFKDAVLRYKTMKGFYVERKAGWDTHGLPTEMETEKHDLESKLEESKAKQKILVIDDDAGIRKLIEFTFKNKYDIISCSSAEDAEAQLEKNDVSLIF